jgi:hypothetical protein
MANLIVGHTTANDVRIWLRGDSQHRTVSLIVRPEGKHVDAGDWAPPPDDEPEARRASSNPDPVAGEVKTGPIELGKSADYTGTIAVGNLTAGTRYSVTATFPQSPAQTVLGRFETFPGRIDGKPVGFSFVLSSCNLSVISINNFLALLLATSGTSAGMNSLDLPLGRWRWPGPLWIRRPVKWILERGLGAVAKLVKKSTGLKQPGPPYLRSPFLKIAAVFRSMILEIESPLESVPAVATTLAWYDDHGVRSGTGVVACTASRIDAEAEEPAPSSGPRRYRVVVTGLEGKRFVKGASVYTEEPVNADGSDAAAIGRVTSAVDGHPWHAIPSFFLHVGDQIYYDFPTENRSPALDEYRLAYREAWFEDDANRYVLSHWPHYMTLDDHELADQFALDFVPPKAPEGSIQPKADVYLTQATAAYREYARALGPDNGSPGQRDRGPFWYTFDKDNAAFFVMDLRTRRKNADGQMIDEEQMTELLHWLTWPSRKHALKFIVTSVPFVAEINDDASDQVPRWASEHAAAPASADTQAPPGRTNPANDKWSAEAFVRQREQIIDCVADNAVEQVVFLTGDMHCCYHATMTIAPKQLTGGESPKYRSLTIHELAGGPVNQLQLATLEEFNRRVTKTTKSGHGYQIDLDRFHGDVNAVLHIEIAYQARARLVADDPGYVPVVDWSVIRTLTDGGADSWVWVPPDRQRAMPRPPLSPRAAKESAMAGRISFVNKREVGDLLPW